MIRVQPTGAALGAQVDGADLREVDDATFGAIHRAWLDHLVLLFRNQTLNDEQMIAFSRRFGDLDWAPVQETGRRFVRQNIAEQVIRDDDVELLRPAHQLHGAIVGEDVVERDVAVALVMHARDHLVP